MKSIFHKISKIEFITSIYVHPVPNNILVRAIKNHELSKYIEVLFCCEDWINDSGNSLVITSRHLSVFYNDKLNIYYWSEFDSVEYNAESKDFVFKLDNKNTGLSITPLFFGLCEFGSANAPLCISFLNLFNQFIKDAHKINKVYDEILEELATLEEQISKSEERDLQKFAEQIIIIYDNYINTFSENLIDFSLLSYLWMAFSIKKEYSESLKVINNLLENYEKEIDLEFWYTAKAETLLELNNDYDAILYYKKAYNVCSDTNLKLKYRDEINEIQTRFNENFINLPYKNRKLIFISDKSIDTFSEYFKVLDFNNLPVNIQFINGLKNNEIYISHPAEKGKYIPLSVYDETLFRERFSEFSLFMDCLGAKKLTYKVIRGKDIDMSQNTTFSGNSSLGYGLYSGNLSLENNKESNSEILDMTKFKRTQVFVPRKAPFLSKELKWYDYEDSWKDIYKQRINGNITKHNDYLISKNSFSISESEMTKIEAELNIVAFSASLNLSETISKTFKQKESIEWEVEFEYETLENIEINRLESLKRNNSSAVLNDKEVKSNSMIIEPKSLVSIKETIITSEIEGEYLEEVKFLLEDDGIIDDKVRRSLERYREKKGISKERAVEIEESLFSFSNLNGNEKEYLDEFQALLNEGEITDKERRMLNRMANRLGLSEDMAKHLEAIVREQID